MEVATKQDILDALKEVRDQAVKTASDAGTAASTASDISSYASDVQSEASSAEERANELVERVDEIVDQVDAITDLNEHERRALALATLAKWNNLYQKVTAEVMDIAYGDGLFTEVDRIALKVLRDIAENADWSFGDLNQAPHLLSTRQWVVGGYATSMIIRALSPQAMISLNDGSVSVHPVVENR
jgi:hypothetical protein